MILIVTHRRGFEADRVIDCLSSLGDPIFRFNTDLLRSGYSVSLSRSDSSVLGRISIDNKSLDIKSVSVAWFQQPWIWPTPISPIEEARQSSHATAITAILDLVKADWLNSPDAAIRASNKLRQLFIARKVGLSVPDTLISNETDTVRDYIHNHPNSVAKSIAPQWVTTSQGDFAAYTQRVELKWLASDDAIAFAPVAYQEFHSRRKDVRVVVVGSEYFPVEYVSDGVQSEYDVRKNTNIECQPCDLPSDIFVGLRKLMQEFAIQFCSADFIVSADGRFYFIDLNVTGSWWWIDDAYSGAITEAISSYLRSRSHAFM